jgi:NAD(P)-dependent dehydrogenase (short-subunit alcohol dehydrogenase family)
MKPSFVDNSPNSRLVGKTIVITGGASGIGEATVYRLLEEGARVIVGDVDRLGAERVAEQVQRMGMLDRFGFSICDVSQESDILSLLRYAITYFGQLDCMINNAGTGGAFNPLIETSNEDWDRTQQINLRGTFLGTKHAGKLMIQQGRGGSIINVSSVAALNGGAAGAAYSASKSGIISLSQCAAVQLGQYHIRCNVIIPGAIVSPLTHRNVDPEGLKEIAKNMQPIPVAGEPYHIAPAFAFLASDDSKFISGSTVVVDGGATAMGQNLYSGQNPFGNAILERARQVGVGSFDFGARSQDNSEKDKSISQPPKVLDELAKTREGNPSFGSKKVLVTGVSRGLGYELCRGFRERGHTVIGCARKQETITALQQEFGAPHHFRQVDVADNNQVEKWAAEVLAEVGPPDLILNNAAIAGIGKQTWLCSDADFDEVLRVNVRGTANVLRHFTPAMIRNKSGIIVNFSSGWGREAAAKVAPYCASKWAVEGLTKAMSYELPPKMAVVSLHPGIIQTDTLRVSFGEAASLYPTPDQWAKVAVPYLLQISSEDNGKQLSVPGMTSFRGMGKLPKMPDSASN